MKRTSLSAALLMFTVAAQAAEKPLNVRFMLADDLGYSDTTLYGTTELYPELNAYLDNDVMPGWFAIEVHEYGDLSGVGGKEWLWMTEWMAGYHAYVMDLAYNSYGVYKTCFWFQSQHYNQMCPYVRVNQMLDEMKGGVLVEVKKQTESDSDKVKNGAISAWKDDSAIPPPD